MNMCLVSLSMINEKIYCAPYSANNVLVIDPNACN